MGLISGDEQNLFEQYIAISSKPLILFIVNESPGLRYGVGTYLQHITKAFKGVSSYDFVVVVLGAYTRSSWLTFEYVGNIPYYFIPSNKYNNQIYYKSIYYFFLSRIKNPRKIIVHCNFACQIPFAEFFKKHENAHLVYTQHYMDWCIRFGPNYLLSKDKIKRDNNALIKFQEEKRMMELADTILVSSIHAYNTIDEIYNIEVSKIKIIPLAIDDVDKTTFNVKSIRRKYNLLPKQKILLYVGRLDDNKGIKSLIEAFLEMSRNDLLLWIVGEGNFEKYLNLIDENNWSRITFWGFRKKDTISEMCAISELGIVPSIYEEFGYVALEMMSNGLPIVVRDTTGLKDIVEKGKWGDLFFDEVGEKSLSKVINYRLTHPHMFQYRYNLSRYMLKKYNVSKFHKLIMDCYNKMIIR